jgi:hypothetical protein
MIEILHYERANKNKIIGFVDIKFPKWNNMIIRKIAHLQSGDRRWFNLPTFSREKLDGTPEYLKYWHFELEVHNGQLLEQLPALVKSFCEKHGIEEHAAVNFDAPLDTTADELPF